MFEVGKKYKHKTAGTIFECILIEHAQVVLRGTGGMAIWWTQEIGEFTEYKEPIKHVLYYNVYRTTVGLARASREEADDVADQTSQTRIACKRVVFTEGEFDD